MTKEERLQYIRQACRIINEIDKYQATSDPTVLSREAIKKLKTKTRWRNGPIRNWHFD